MAEFEPQQNRPEAETVIVAEQVEETVVSVPVGRPRRVYSGMWGTPEIVAIGIGVASILIASLAFFFFVVPSNRELAHNRSEADRLEADVISAEARYGEITSTQNQVDKVLTSVDDFEMQYLPVVSTGQAALYQRINSLIMGYGLTNTTGPDYAPLETAEQDAGQQSDEEKGRAKFRSLYPGVYVTTTVEGPYANLRRFIREIETGREFIIVSAVELAPSDSERPRNEAPQNQPQTAQINPATQYEPARPNAGRGVPPGMDPRFAQQFGAQPAPQPRRQQGKMHGDIVSLRIELAAYFRRPNFAPQVQQ